jgi:hypothetical protein
VPPLPPRKRQPSAGPSGGLLRAVLVGAVLALVLRLLLAAPTDLYARLSGGASQPPAGSVERWLQSPLADEGYLRSFVLAVWWVGAVVGVLLVRQRGGRWSDLIFGAIAGASAGFAGAATLGCVLALLDAVPRHLMATLLGGHGHGLPSVVATGLWLVLAVGWWTLLGAVVALVLATVGRGGARLLAAGARPAVWLFRQFRLERAADFFALQG